MSEFGAPERFRATFDALRREIAKVIVGQHEIVEQMLTCLVAGGHALLEGVPGLGKTLMVRTLARTLDLRFARIQFTPDLMPADITGTNVAVDEGGRRRFQLQRGPIFANVVLADEINRATPKTQSAMLEAMQESSVTIAGQMCRLEKPFFVLATQNPIEMEGTYPLPEAQLDRFMLKLKVEFPSLTELDAIVDLTTSAEEQSVEPVAGAHDVLEMQRTVRAVAIASHVKEFAARLVLATHPNHEAAPPDVQRFVRYGSSPRGLQALVLTGKVNALLAGRVHVSTQDIKRAAKPALRHRMVLSFEGDAEGVNTDDLIAEVAEVVAANTSVCEP